MDITLVIYAIFWISGAIALIARVVSVWRQPSEIISPVTFVVVGFFWIYIIGYFTLDTWSKTVYFSESGYLKVLLLACLAAGAFWLGFQREVTGTLFVTYLEERPLKLLGIFLILLGVVGWVYFLILSGGYYEYYSAPHGTAGAWEHTTAYLYVAPLLMYPGAFILLSLYSNRRLEFLSFLILLGSIFFLILDSWLAGSRGGWLRLGVLLSVYMVFLRQSSSQSRILPTSLFGLVTALVLLTPFLRSAVYFGAEQPIAEAIREALGALSEQGGPGHELVFASALVQSASEQGIVDFGFQWLHPIIDVIPRLWWPEKPYASDFSLSYDLALWSSVGWIAERGSAPTGVADGFLRFSWASPLVWLLLGLLGRRLYSIAKLSRDSITVGYLTAYLFGLVYMITQGFNPAVYAFIFMAAPLYFSFLLARWAAMNSGRIR